MRLFVSSDDEADYVGAILGLVRDGTDWRLDPLMVRLDLILSALRLIDGLRLDHA